jgi:hypothetical protein
LLSIAPEGSTALTAGTSTTTPFFAACSAPCIENFDNVTTPALPSGWTTTLRVGQPGDQAWKTTTTSFESAPNSAFVNGATHATDIQLDSPAIPIRSTGAVLTFKRKHNLEADFDGMVLEISIPSVAGGAFLDISSGTGGSFIEGEYRSSIRGTANSSIAGRLAWSGDTGSDFITTSVKLPFAANGQSVRFRWRVVTDTSVSTGGAFIDSIALILPPNDNFSNAQPILGRSGIILGRNIGATKETGESNHAGNTGGASVWYKWQAPEDGRFVFATFGSDFATVIAVYTGSSLPSTNTTPVASNSIEPRGCPGSFGSLPQDSRVAFEAVGGVFYHIAIDTRNGTTGDIELRWGASATISGRISGISGNPPTVTPIVKLKGSACRISESNGGIFFTDVPKGHIYSIDPEPPTDPPTFAGFTPWGTTASISPLTSDVSDYNFYQSSPTISIKSKVFMPGNDTRDLTVTCVSKPLGANATVPVDVVITQTASDQKDGNYLCSSLPIGGDYVVTPAKLGFSFVPPSRTFTHLTVDILDGNFFDGVVAPTRMISGRVTLPDGTTGVSGITIALSGSQTDSKVTSANGDYSFTGILQGGNYTVTPANANFTFTPLSSTFNILSADQTAGFTASFLVQLILEESGRVAALDSVLLTKDPFTLLNNNVLYPDADRHTRVVVFASGLALGPGELPSSVKINLVGSDGQTYEISAADVRSTSVPQFTQIVFELPDNLSSGICTLSVKFHGLTSNIGAMTIKP